MENVSKSPSETAAVLALFSATEKKISGILSENVSAKLSLDIIRSENDMNNEKLKVFGRENECLRKMVTNYETTFKTWKKMEDENKTLKETLLAKEKEFETKIDTDRRSYLLEIESARKEATKILNETREQLKQTTAENKKLKSHVEDMQLAHNKTIANMKLDFEKRIVELECVGPKKPGGPAYLAGMFREDSGRLHAAFQMKLEHMKNEYEQKIAKLQSEIETLQQYKQKDVGRVALKRPSFGANSRPPQPLSINLPEPPAMPSHFGNRVAPSPTKKPFHTAQQTASKQAPTFDISDNDLSD